MKAVGVISTAVLSMILGIAALAYAQQEQHDQQEEQKAKPAQNEKQAQPAKQQEKSAQQDKNTNQEEKSAQQENKNTQQEEKNAQQQDKNAKQEEHNAPQHTQETRTEQTHYAGRIPEDRFRANFGREHVFIINRPVIVEGAPRFQYGGYWFGFGEPWPVGWEIGRAHV